MRTLLVKTSSLGDVIHALPAVSDAVTALPDMRLDWAVEEDYADLAALHWGVAAGAVNIIPVALRRWRRRPWGRQREEWRNLRERLQHTGYQRVIDAQGLIKSAWLIRGLKQRCGYDSASVRERLAGLAYDHRYAVALDQHAVDRIRQLVALALDYALPSSLPDFGLGRWQRPQPDAGVMLLHGSSGDHKLWPEPCWRELIERLAESGIRCALPWGSQAEEERARRLAEGVATAQVLPALSLSALQVSLQRYGAVVSVDTGLGHLAAAQGIPCVSLYGPTDPRRIGTLGVSSVHLKSPRGLAGIPAREVYAAVLRQRGAED